MESPSPSVIASTMQDRTKYYNVEILRALAQLMIIASHMQFWFTWKDRPDLIQYVRLIFENSTLPFLIISGFLFSKYGHRDTTSIFYRKKLKKVVFPYLIAFFPVFIFLFFFPEVTAQLAQFIQMRLRPLWQTLFTGQNPINIAMWFFPVIITFYGLFPFFKKVYFNNRYLLIFLFLSLTTSLLIHRPSTTANMVHSFLYFVFPYTLGITLGKFEDVSFRFLKQTHLIFLGFLVLVYFWQTQYGPRGGIDRISSFGQISIFHPDSSLLQKSIFSVLILFYFRNSGSELFFVKVAQKVSEYSFGLHLYHGYFLSALLLTFGPVFEGAGMIQFFFGFLTVLVITWWFCILLIKVLPKSGRFLIGR